MVQQHGHRSAAGVRGGPPIPALVFIHIPLWEYRAALKQRRHCFGVADDGITPTFSNTGLFSALDAAPEVQAVGGSFDFFSSCF